MHADLTATVTSRGKCGSAIHSRPTLCISFARHECDRRGRENYINTGLLTVSEYVDKFARFLFAHGQDF